MVITWIKTRDKTISTRMTDSLVAKAISSDRSHGEEAVRREAVASSREAAIDYVAFLGLNMDKQKSLP
jgi:hypothetical protein